MYFQGDSLATTCTDSTKNRKNVVLVKFNANYITYFTTILSDHNHFRIHKLPIIVKYLIPKITSDNSSFLNSKLKHRASFFSLLVQGGYAISDEMCVNYIHYFPKVELEVCKSSVATPSLYGFFNFLKE